MSVLKTEEGDVITVDTVEGDKILLCVTDKNRYGATSSCLNKEDVQKLIELLQPKEGD